jgi:exosortase C (VPDSG-CTERM-specific)
LSAIDPTKLPEGCARRWCVFAAAASALVVCFMRPLRELGRFAYSSELYSYIFLVPVISAYLIYLRQKRPVPVSVSGPKFTAPFIVAGCLALGTYFFLDRSGHGLVGADSLVLPILSFVFFFWGLCGLCWGHERLQGLTFPLGFLILMVPFSSFLRGWLESFLQQCSAYAALGLFRLSGTPVYYHNLVFELPDISIQVAPECSGIHSTIALFITGLLAGYLFLHSNWRRSALVAVILPVAILRNGFRVFTIGELCVHIGPEMINSNIHHKGGPIFFVLSLIPLILFLRYLIKSEHPAPSPTPNLS